MFFSLQPFLHTVPKPRGRGPEHLHVLDVKEALAGAGLEFESAEVTFTPSTTVELDVEGGRKILRLIDTLEDQDDVQKVYHNAEIPEEAYG